MTALVKRALEIAASQVGVKEVGRNRGERVEEYLAARRTRLAVIRTQAQTIAAAGSLTTAQLTTHIKTLASAVDDLAQYDIRLGRALLQHFDQAD